MHLTLLPRCEEFARQGCKVYASSRRTETIADFADSNIEKLSLDVTSDESVQKALAEIVEKEGKIDIVVNNAGVIAAGTCPHFDRFVEIPIVDPSFHHRAPAVIVDISNLSRSTPLPPLGSCRLWEYQPKADPILNDRPPCRTSD